MHKRSKPARNPGLLASLRARLQRNNLRYAKSQPGFSPDPSTAQSSPALRKLPDISTSSAYAHDGWISLVPWLIPRRSTFVIKPPGDEPPKRLLLLLHGCQQEAEDFARDTGAYNLASQHGWLVLLMSQSSLANPHRCWNWFDTNTQRGGGEVAIAMNALDSVAREWGLPPEQIYLAGMSSGAALGAAICANHGDRFAGAMFHSGVPFGASESALDVRDVLKNGPRRDVTRLVESGSCTAALVIHGADDPAVNPSHAHELMRQMLTQSGHINTGDSLPSGRSTRRQLAANRFMTTTDYGPHRHVSIDGLGHAWSGGIASDAPFFDATGPDALEMMRTYFDEVENRPQAAVIAPLAQVTELA